MSESLRALAVALHFKEWSTYNLGFNKAAAESTTSEYINNSNWAAMDQSDSSKFRHNALCSLKAMRAVSRYISPSASSYWKGKDEIVSIKHLSDVGDSYASRPTSYLDLEDKTRIPTILAGLSLMSSITIEHSMWLALRICAVLSEEQKASDLEAAVEDVLHKICTESERRHAARIALAAGASSYTNLKIVEDSKYPGDYCFKQTPHCHLSPDGIRKLGLALFAFSSDTDLLKELQKHQQPALKTN